MSETENNEQDSSEEKSYDLSNWGDLISIFKDDLPDDKVKSLISEHIQNVIDKSDIKGYEVVFLYDDEKFISSFHSNRIYLRREHARTINH